MKETILSNWNNLDFKEKIKFTFLIFLFLLTINLIFNYFNFKNNHQLEIAFLNVGQGDATFIKTPSNKKILIDSGKDAGVLTKLGQKIPNNNFINLLMRGNLHQFEIIIATHDDIDHIGALPLILKKYGTKILLTSLLENNSDTWKEVIKIAKEKNIIIKNIEQPSVINFNDGSKIKILFPIQNMNGIEDGNQASVVTQIIHGRNKILTTGDLGVDGELFLNSIYGDELKSDILKLGHHGSDTSTHPEFLAKVKPAVAIVSAGENNSFGHPHQSVINLLNKFKISILETSKENSITFVSDGINLWRN